MAMSEEGRERLQREAARYVKAKSLQSDVIAKFLGFWDGWRMACLFPVSSWRTAEIGACSNHTV